MAGECDKTDRDRHSNRKGQKGEHTMIGPICMDVWMYDVCMDEARVLSQRREAEREREMVIRTQDDDSIQPWKW